MDPNDTNSQLQARFLLMIQRIAASHGITIPHTPMQQHSVGPVMGQHYQYQYQPPPSSNQWRRRTEARYHSNHIVPQLSGTTRRGWSTNNEGAGSAQTPPSSNSPMADSNRPQKRQRKPYNRDHSGPSRRRPRSDLSVYEVPIVEMPTGTTAGGSNTPAVVPSPAPLTLSTLAPSAPSTSSTSGPSLSPPATPTAAPAPPAWAWMGIPVRPDEDAATDADTNMREQPDEEEDYHTISSGSDTE